MLAGLGCLMLFGSVFGVQVIEFYTDHLAEYHKEFPKLRSATASALTSGESLMSH